MDTLHIYHQHRTSLVLIQLRDIHKLLFNKEVRLLPVPRITVTFQNIRYLDLIFQAPLTGRAQDNGKLRMTVNIVVILQGTIASNAIILESSLLQARLVAIAVVFLAWDLLTFVLI